jgi:hypothetical protein
MTQIFLAIIFMINGEPTIMDGWEMREYPTMEICDTRKEFMTTYTNGIDNLPKVGVIYCGTVAEIQHQLTILNSELL